MHIRHSTPNDIPRIMEIYRTARSFMAAHDNPNQWGATNWPPEELIRQDIADGNSYVCVESPGFENSSPGTENSSPGSENSSTGTENSSTGTESIRNQNDPACPEEDIIATFFYTSGYRCEPTYNEIIDGKWIGNDTYGVVHRIASSGTVRGAGAFCLDWAFRKCKHLRIDTHPDNYVMQNLLKKLGFQQCGTIYVIEDNDPRLAYEKTDTE